MLLNKIANECFCSQVDLSSPLSAGPVPLPHHRQRGWLAVPVLAQAARPFGFGAVSVEAVHQRQGAESAEPGRRKRRLLFRFRRRDGERRRVDFGGRPVVERRRRASAESSRRGHSAAGNARRAGRSPDEGLASTPAGRRSSQPLCPRTAGRAGRNPRPHLGQSRPASTFSLSYYGSVTITT